MSDIIISQTRSISFGKQLLPSFCIQGYCIPKPTKYHILDDPGLTLTEDIKERDSKVLHRLLLALTSHLDLGKLLHISKSSCCEMAMIINSSQGFCDERIKQCTQGAQHGARHRGRAY